MSNKLIIISAPSGAGKSTIVHYLLAQNIGLEFSISATSRLPRGAEKNGQEYYFLSPENFKQKIENQEFIEYEEVYENLFYGTLRSEIDRIVSKGKIAIFDVDVVGGLNIKKQFGDDALAIFIAPPSIEILQKRLVERATDTTEMIQKRVAKANYEMTFAPQFDLTVVNDDLQKTQNHVKNRIIDFLEKK